MKTYKVTVNSAGTIIWYINGKLHREDGPAIVDDYGNERWFLNDKLHREDGPAVMDADGEKRWYINDERLTEEEFNNQTKPCIGKKVIVDGIEYTLK